MKPFVGITGTTCVGKSAVAVQLAKLLDTEVVSADSMQIYKGMDIGTAKIIPEEMQGVVHHMIDIVEPDQDYSSFLYQQQAAPILDRLSLPVVAGGTGFYFDSLVFPPEYGNASEARREELRRIYSEKGLQPLVETLAKLDPSAMEVVDCKNYKRVIRAIEIAETGGSITKGQTRRNPRYDMILFVLRREREKLYRNINDRVDAMIKNGLTEEVQTLVNKYGFCKKPSFEAIGYKEIISYLRGEITLYEAIEQIKINTRHYAKKQITYYKRMNVAEYIDVDGKTPEEIAQTIYKKLQTDGIVTGK